MKNLSKALVFAALSLTVVSSAFAQAAGPVGGGLTQKGAGKGAGKGGNRPVMQFFQSLNLTSDQKQKIGALMKQTASDNKAFREAHPGDINAMKDHTKSAKTTFDKGLQGILTPDQFQKYTEFVSESKMKKARDAKVLSDLNLTSDQQAKVKGLQATEKSANQSAVIQNVGNPQAIGQAVMTNHQTYLTGLQTVLTPAQYSTYQTEMSKVRKGGGKKKNV